MAQHNMLPNSVKEPPSFFFFQTSSCDFQDISFLLKQFQKLSLSAPFETCPTNAINQALEDKPVKMASPQPIFDPTSLFAEHAQFLTSFNPDFHLDDSYLQVHHPERVEGLFSRRFAQLPIVGEDSPLNMDPLDWRYMYRPNRPFHYITNRNLRRTIPKRPPRPWLERKRQVPTAYYLQQMELFNATPPPIPEVEATDKGRTSGPLKVWVQFAWAVLVSVAWLLRALLTSVVGGLMMLGRVGIQAYRKVDNFPPLETLWIALAARLLMRLLPGIEGEGEGVEEVMKAGEPLYVLMIRNPHQFRKSPLLECWETLLMRVGSGQIIVARL